jgi:hypothetical protein
MAQSDRLESLTSLARMIALRLDDVQQRMAKHGEVVSPEIRARHFDQMADRSEGMRGGPTTTAELALLATRLVPDAVALLNQRSAA